MPSILRVDQANVDYIYAKTASGKVYVPGHVIQMTTSSNSTAIYSTSTSFIDLWSFSINNVSSGSKIIIQLSYCSLIEGSEGSAWRIIRSSDSAVVGTTQTQQSRSLSGWAHIYSTLIVTDASPSVGTNTYKLQAKGSTSPSTTAIYYNYAADAGPTVSYVSLTEVAQ